MGRFQMQNPPLQTCAYDSGAVMITKLESFETSLEQIESIMGKDKFKDVKQGGNSVETIWLEF